MLVYLLYEREKNRLEQKYGYSYVAEFGDAIPAYLLFGGAGGAAVGLIIGMFGYVINKEREPIETIKLLGK